ncbi:MAG: hypothetical protein ACQKBV_05775 [Puniceicoccales bacterium]
MNSKWLLFAAAWVATLVGAYIVGQSTSSSPAAQSVASAAQIAKANAQQRGADDSLAAELAEANAEATLAEEEAADALEETKAFNAMLSGDMSRETLMKATLEALSYDSDELEAAIAQLQQMPPSRERSQLLYEMLNRWGQIDPNRALAYANGIESMQDRSRAMGEVLEGWGARDPVSALAWLDKSGAELGARAYGNYLENIMEGYAETNPSSAFRFAQNLPEDTQMARRTKHSVMRDVVDAMVSQNKIQEAIDLTVSMEDGRMRTETLEEIIDEWTEADPLAAKAFLESMADDPAFADMQRDFLRGWAESDPVAASEWLNTLDPEDPNMPHLATSLVERWTRYDINAAADWLNSVPQSPEMDRAVAIFSMRAAQDDPRTALESWVPSISNEEMRDRMTRSIAPQFREQDPEGFEEYLTASDFTDEVKQELREAQPRGGRRGWYGR